MRLRRRSSTSRRSEIHRLWWSGLDYVLYFAVDSSFVVDVLVGRTIAATAELATNAILAYRFAFVAFLLALPAGVTACFRAMCKVTLSLGSRISARGLSCYTGYSVDEP